MCILGIDPIVCPLYFVFALLSVVGSVVLTFNTVTEFQLDSIKAFEKGKTCSYRNSCEFDFHIIHFHSIYVFEQITVWETEIYLV